MGGGSTGFRAVGFDERASLTLASHARIELTLFFPVDGDESLFGLLPDVKLDVGAKLDIISWESGVVRWRTPRRVSAVPAQWRNLRMVLLLLLLLRRIHIAHENRHVVALGRPIVGGHHLGVRRARSPRLSRDESLGEMVGWLYRGGRDFRSGHRLKAGTAVFQAREADKSRIRTPACGGNS